MDQRRGCYLRRRTLGHCDVVVQEMEMVRELLLLSLHEQVEIVEVQAEVVQEMENVPVLILQGVHHVLVGER